MVAREREAFFEGVNEYVPAMAYAASGIHDTAVAFDLGIPATAAIAAVSSSAGAANGTAGTVSRLTTVVTLDGTYGRTIRADLSGVPGNAPVVEVIGEDYLGQPMAERFTGSAAATTTTSSASKAFKRVMGTRIITAATNAVTYTIGTGTSLGIPYKCILIWAKEGTPPAAQIDPANLFANHTKGVETDPATGSTGDPRGLYVPDNAPNGVRQYILGIIGDNSVNAAGNGGLHGIRHFF